VFDAGRAVPVSGNTAAILSGSWLAKHFRARRTPVPPSPVVWRAMLCSQAMRDAARHPEPAGQASYPGSALGGGALTAVIVSGWPSTHHIALVARPAVKRQLQSAPSGV